PGVRAVQPAYVPAMQTSVPLPQMLEHIRERPSSVLPLQLSSTLLQISTPGTRALHMPNVPVVHVRTPLPQAVEQACVTPSSISMSQSSSRLLQVSARGSQSGTRPVPRT